MPAPAQPSQLATYEPSAQPLLLPARVKILNPYLALLGREAQQRNVSTERPRVSGLPASDEGPARLLITQKVALSVDDALAYWSALGEAVERWAGGLDASSATIARDQIILSVEWDDGPTNV